MDPKKIKEMQEIFLQFQKTISETVSSPNNEICVTFNGNIEITQLVIDKNVPENLLNQLLIETINKGIKNTSVKIQGALVTVQKMNN